MQIFKPLNKKALIEMIKADFQLLFMHIPKRQLNISTSSQKNYYDIKNGNSLWRVVTSIDCSRLLSLESYTIDKLNTLIKINSLPTQQSENIQIEHSNNSFKLSILKIKQ